MKIQTYQDLLKRVARLMPVGVKVILLGDRGFIEPKLMKYVRQQLGWSYRIRIKSDFWICRPGKGWCQVKDFHSVGDKPGYSKMFSSIKQTHMVRSISLWLVRELGSNSGTLSVMNRPLFRRFVNMAYASTLRKVFVLDKSNGFELESSEIRNAPALSRLCLVLALATLYLTAQGTEVVAQGKRRWVDPHWFRGSSYLKIGWNWVKTARSSRLGVVSNPHFT